MAKTNLRKPARLTGVILRPELRAALEERARREGRTLSNLAAYLIARGLSESARLD